ncbi:hypothetical protein PAHAL_9G085200 [Panicum hallii]|uniref:Uncharacterized protein n=1 Tax=Panicum hallii TaxID=206008 RepID=A0A2T8I0P7_9POAL|nr:hypothetical protein PAHAL_9G085200 [Panicum hallii]
MDLQNPKFRLLKQCKSSCLKRYSRRSSSRGTPASQGPHVIHTYSAASLFSVGVLSPGATPGSAVVTDGRGVNGPAQLFTSEEVQNQREAAGRQKKGQLVSLIRGKNSTRQARVAHVGVDLLGLAELTKGEAETAETAQELRKSWKKRAKSFPCTRDPIRLTRSDSPRALLE